LGAGPPGSGRDFKALKKHPFFAGIDWKNLNKIRPPLKSKSVAQKNLFRQAGAKSSFEKNLQPSGPQHKSPEKRLQNPFGEIDEETKGTSNDFPALKSKSRAISANPRTINNTLSKNSPMLASRKELLI
jgi:hypothetical protein